ncbi:hypothetical protein [Streptomyces sp. NPDC088358]|uniref:hypothetical protein n=1 Tax=Streptomyces sp. NPDC088358 TaxID=3365857 RepID=UPI003820F9BE
MTAHDRLERGTPPVFLQERDGQAVVTGGASGRDSDGRDLVFDLDLEASRNRPSV